MVTKVAMVDGWIKPSTILLPTQLNKNHNTHIPVETEIVLTQQELDHSKSPPGLMLPPTAQLPSNKPLLNNQFQLLLKLTRWSSKCTLEVSSTKPHAEPTLIMESS